MSNVSTVQFRAGRLVLTDASGAFPVAELTDITVAHDATDKALPSDDQVSSFSVRTEQKLTVKAKVQRVLSSRLHAAMFGGTVTSGSAKQVVDREAVTATAGSFTVAAGVAFSADLGVYDANGNPMEPVAAAPTLGQYVAGVAGTGTYTVNAAEPAGLHASYVKTSTAGETVTVDNQAQGASPTLSGWFYSSTKQPDGSTKQVASHFYSLVPSKLSEAQKRGDFADSDIELTANANASGKFFERHQS